MKSKWISYKEKQVLYADYADFGNDHEALEIEVDAITDILLGGPDKSVLLLVDVRNTVGSSEATDCLKKSALKVKEKVHKTAVVGVEGYRKILLRAVSAFSGMDLTPVDDPDEAKEWLVRET